MTGRVGTEKRVVAAVKRAVRAVLPWPAERRLRALWWRGSRHQCPVCGSRVRLLQDQGYGYPMLEELEVIGGMRKAEDVCPVCQSSDRIRHVFLYLNRETTIFSGTHSVLHFAPEAGILDHLRANRNLQYVITDLDPARYRNLASDVRSFDIAAIPFPDDSFDFVICNHVLEHVENDHRAMRELARVLRPDGQAILQVPIAARLERTREGVEGVVTDEDRIRVYGQSDHIRLYARDYGDRLRAAGLDVTLWNACRARPDEATAYRINPREDLYVCRKR